MSEHATQGVQADICQVQFTATRLGQNIAVVFPQADVVVATVPHAAGARLWHEARLDAKLARHLAADQAISHQAIGSELARVEHPVQFELTRIFVIAFDHVQAHGDRIFHDAFVDRAHEFKVAHVIGRACSRADLYFQLVTEPGHFRLAARLHP